MLVFLVSFNHKFYNQCCINKTKINKNYFNNVLYLPNLPNFLTISMRKKYVEIVYKNEKKKPKK